MMKLIEYNIYVRNGRDASSKAKQDVSRILHSLGYRKLYNPSQYRLIRIVQQFLSILFIEKDSVLVIQYHSNISFFYRLIGFFKKVKKIAVIHDLESLRGNISVRKEISLLNGFDQIISHNPCMTKFLNDNGLTKPIFNLMIFDYLLNEKIKITNNFNRYSIFFAGNLVKSAFLMKLFRIKDIQFNIYGADYDGIESLKSQSNVNYKGSYSPEQLIANIEGGWGLVWDGESLDTCSGITGKYLRYNNPHKVSMCIASERPVIIWSQSAMADYILSNELGIVIDSLMDLPAKIAQITAAKYNEMLANVKKEKKILIRGGQLKKVLADMNL